MVSKKTLPPTYFNSALLLMILLHFLIPLFDSIDFPYNLSGVLFIFAGGLLNLWADRLFKEHSTTVKPFEESAWLIMDGPFRFSRNPMYLGMVLILLGVFLLLGSVSSFLVIPVFMILLQQNFIMPEEQALTQKFGTEFTDYKTKVRRWL